MKLEITKKKILKLNSTEPKNFPKYTTQIMNLAGSNGQATRPNVVGQLSEMFPEFQEQYPNGSVEDWRKYYKKEKPGKIKTATEKISAQVKNLKSAINKIDDDMIEKWVEDLVVDKTYQGLSYQKAVLMELANKTKKEFKHASPSDEAKGIDGYVGGVPYSVKPDSYKNQSKRLHENINVKMVYYPQNASGDKIIFDVED